MIQTNDNKVERIKQGDILTDVEYIEYADVVDGVIKVSKIVFPLVIVLTQDCDLTWDFDSRKNATGTQDKYLFLQLWHHCITMSIL